MECSGIQSSMPSNRKKGKQVSMVRQVSVGDEDTVAQFSGHHHQQKRSQEGGPYKEVPMTTSPRPTEITNQPSPSCPQAVPGSVIYTLHGWGVNYPLVLAKEKRSRPTHHQASTFLIFTAWVLPEPEWKCHGNWVLFLLSAPPHHTARRQQPPLINGGHVPRPPGKAPEHNEPCRHGAFLYTPMVRLIYKSYVVRDNIYLTPPTTT